MIKAIIFDVGGVLIDNPAHGMFHNYSQHLQTDKEKFTEVYQEFADEWQAGKLHEPDFWQKMCHKLEVSLPKSESLWLEGFKDIYKEKDDVFKLIEKLKQRGYKLGLLSNTETPIMHFLIEKQYPHFDVFVYSCAEGCIKPYEEIYLLTAKRLGVKPTEAVFIDDKPENVEGAEKVGMKGVLFESPQQLEKELESYL